jgi:RNA polymerase sigma-70 factor (ECF subfamily)
MDATERVLTLPLLEARRRLVVERQENTRSGAPSDEDLLLRVQQRDEEALLVLFRRYNTLVYSVGYRILRDHGEAEDLVQEVFLRLHAKAKTFDPAKGAARAWFVQMIYRRAFDRRAYLGRRHFYDGTDGFEQANAIAGERNTEEEIVERLTAQQLRTAFSELSEKQRETLEMFFFEGLNLAEIAERSGEDVKNVRHHYYRGLERLRHAAHAMMRGGKSDP